MCSILIAGGTGNVGSACVRALSGAGVQVRVLTRDAMSEKAARLAALPKVTLVQGEYGDAASLQKALEGVSMAFLGNANTHTQVQEEKGFIDAAAASGSCKYLVKLGTCNVGDYMQAIEYGRFHAEIEAHLRATNLEWTVLHPNDFMQNHLGDIFGTLPLGIVAYPFPVGAEATIVDTEDVGEVVAALLQAKDRSKHVGQHYDVAGPEPMTTGALAAMYTEALGRPIAAVQCSAEEWVANGVKAGFPDWFARAICTQFTDFWGTGKLNFPSSPAILELCPPRRTMKAWIEVHAPLSPKPSSL